MSIMAKTPSGYKKIGSAYLGERPVDKVFNANGDVVYALQRELTGVPPLLFKGKEQSELLNYRIYGDTVDGESVGDRTGNLFDGEIMIGGLSDSTGSEVDGILTRLRTSWIKVEPSETYSFNLNNLDYKIRNIYVYDESKSFIYTSEVSSNSATVTVSALASYVRFVFRKNDGSETVTISDCREKFMFNTGSTPLPYEPYGYKVPVTVEGKNLFSSRIEQGSFDGITGVPNNSSTRVRSHEDDYIFLTPGVYKISAMGVEHLVVYAYDLPDVNAFNYNLSRTNWAPLPSTITINTSAYYKFSFCKTNNPIITPSDISNIMLNAGSTALPYEPYHAPVTTPIYLPEPIKMVGDEAEYVDYKEQKQHRVRKNLLQNTATSLTTYGVTITVNDDGSVTCNGTATSTIVFLFFEKELGQNTYILSGCPENGAHNERYKIQMNPGDGWYADIGNGLEFEIQNTSTIKVRLVIYPSYTCNNLTFYPMIRKADIEDDTYEPYIEDTDLDVTLPALPTIKGTNTMSVDTAVQPSRMDIKGRIKTTT